MKKRVSLFIAALGAIAVVLLFGGCGETVVALDAELPWATPLSLYEYSEFSVRGSMKSGDSTVDVSVGNVKFTLKEADGNVVLTMEARLEHLDIEENGSERGLVDTAASEVVFDKKTLLPITSKKSVVLADRKGKLNNSYELDLSYTQKRGELTFTEQGGEKQTRRIKADGQVFDNEQLYYVVRAFSSLSPKAYLNFNLYNGFDAFNYDLGVYKMGVSVDADPVTVTLSDWKDPDKTFGMDLDESGVPCPSCYSARITISENENGSPIYAKYSENPFKISDSISTKKVLTAFSTTSFNADYTKLFTMDYTLCDYRAVV